MIPVVYVMIDERLQRFDFTYNFMFGGTAFAMAKPKIEIQWQALFRPLSSLVWVGVATSTIATAALLWLVSGKTRLVHVLAFAIFLEYIFCESLIVFTISDVSKLIQGHILSGS